MTEKMNLTRALYESKQLKARIEKQIQNSCFVGLVQGKDLNPYDKNFRTSDEMVKNFKSNHQSVQDLMNRRLAVKRAITKANAVTNVIVNGQTMSIADALEMKNSLPLYQLLLKRMVQDLTNNVSVHNSLTQQLEAQANDLASKSAGSASKVTDEQLKTFRNVLAERLEPKFVDPLDIREKIAQQEQLIETLSGELNFVLSEVNAKTEIEV